MSCHSAPLDVSLREEDVQTPVNCPDMMGRAPETRWLDYTCCPSSCDTSQSNFLPPVGLLVSLGTETAFGNVTVKTHLLRNCSWWLWHITSPERQIQERRECEL